MPQRPFEKRRCVHILANASRYPAPIPMLASHGNIDNRSGSLQLYTIHSRRMQECCLMAMQPLASIVNTGGRTNRTSTSLLHPSQGVTCTRRRCNRSLDGLFQRSQTLAFVRTDRRNTSTACKSSTWMRRFPVGNWPVRKERESIFPDQSPAIASVTRHRYCELGCE